MEVQKALEKGYKLLQIHEVWHFNEVKFYDSDTKEGGLFADYVNAFLKMKQEASDWPSWCRTDEQRHQYIRRYCEKEGIHLEWDKIKKNPGLRAIAKHMNFLAHAKQHTSATTQKSTKTPLKTR